MNIKYETIFQSFTFPSGVEVKNRIMIAPMTHYSSQPSGEVSEQELPYYAERSGGVGTVITACAMLALTEKGSKINSAWMMTHLFRD